MNRLLICLVLLTAAPCSALAADVALRTVPENAPTAGVGATAAVADNQIGAKDTLAIDVFDVPALSQTVQVDNAGFINLPLIGQVEARGRTPNQLSADITTALRTKYMKNPIVTVAIKEAASKKITVDGSVTQPGLYEIGPGTTLMQAVAMAHGPDQVADVHHVAIIRSGPEGRSTTVYDLDDIRDGKVVDPAVRADDTVVVDVSGTRKFVRDFGGVISVLGWLHP